MPREDSALLQTAGLIEQAKAGDEQARAELVLRYHEPLARFLHARLPPSARGLLETGDIVQEALSVALLRLERFEYRGIGSFWSYLRRIGLNLVAQQARRRGLVIDRSGEPPSPEESPPIALLRKESREAFEAALERVPEPGRGALLLRLELGFSYESVARDCGYPSPDAARMAIGRALARLAKDLGRSGIGP